jgi:chromosome segregation and condensation protein ScpB
MHAFWELPMAWSEEDLVRALATAGTKGLTAAALAKAISAPADSKQLSSAITRLKSRGAVRGPFRMGRLSLFFEAKSAPTREHLESRIQDVLRRAGTRVTTRSDLDKAMKGVVQSLYRDAISALRAEGKIVELHNARRSPLYIHRDAIIDQLGLESDRDRPQPEPASISLDDLRPHYLTLKAEQGGISAVKIYDILKRLGVSKEKLHALLLREAQRGRVSLHATSTVNFPREVMEAAITIEGEQQPYVTFILREAS